MKSRVPWILALLFALAPGVLAAQGDAVKQAQQVLVLQGYEIGAVDGRLGPRTRAALRQFQEMHGLAPSGELDAGTRAALGLEGSAAGGGSAPPREAPEPLSCDGLVGPDLLACLDSGGTIKANDMRAAR